MCSSSVGELVCRGRSIGPTVMKTLIPPSLTPINVNVTVTMAPISIPTDTTRSTRQTQLELALLEPLGYAALSLFRLLRG